MARLKAKQETTVNVTKSMMTEEGYEACLRKSETWDSCFSSPRTVSLFMLSATALAVLAGYKMGHFGRDAANETT